jgi:hypothetical protein
MVWARMAVGTGSNGGAKPAEPVAHLSGNRPLLTPAVNALLELHRQQSPDCRYANRIRAWVGKMELLRRGMGAGASSAFPDRAPWIHTLRLLE